MTQEWVWATAIVGPLAWLTRATGLVPSSATFMGETWGLVVLPMPTWPWELWPQHLTRPVVVTAHTCVLVKLASPWLTATAAALHCGAVPVTTTGVDTAMA